MSLFNNTENLENKIYYKIINISRNPFFFDTFNICDDFEGRFEVLVINFSIILWILKKKEENEILSQKLIDIFFEDMDASLRELGVSDLSVGKKIKVLAENFYGRLSNYTQSFNKISSQGNTDLLKKSIRKNIATKSNSYKSFKTDKVSNYFYKVIKKFDNKLKKIEDIFVVDFFKV